MNRRQNDGNARGFLKLSQVAVDLGAGMEVCNMYIRKLQSLQIKFTFVTSQTKTQKHALIDSGATENFIDIEVWEQLGIRKCRMDHPAIIYNVDGTENRKGRIQYYCWLKVCINGKAKGMRFFLTGLGNDRFILGYPFLCEFNPQIDWSLGSLAKGHVVISTLGREKPWEPREF